MALLPNGYYILVICPEVVKISDKHCTELTKKVCPRLRDLAIAPAGGITHSHIARPILTNKRWPGNLHDA